MMEFQHMNFHDKMVELARRQDGGSLTTVDGTVYWGAGYTHLGLPMFTGNNKLYAFTLNGK